MSLNKWNKILGYAGLIPFYIFSIASMLANYNFFIDIFFLYSVIILCFLSGSLWMKLILLPQQKQNFLFKCLAVIFPLIALISELFVSYYLKIAIYILIYILIYICDKRTVSNGLSEYIRMRLFLTGHVILTHFILLYTVFTYSVL